MKVKWGAAGRVAPLNTLIKAWGGTRVCLFFVGWPADQVFKRVSPAL